jgi:hypothetical protein
MNVLGDLVARDRRSSDPAIRVTATDRSITYRDFCTTAYKAGNVFRYLGVREGTTVVVVGTIGPQPVWAFYGAAQLGAVTRFVDVGGGDGDRLAADDPRVLLVPVDHEPSLDPGPSTKLAVYGGGPARATTLHWEKELWSENPAVHPAEVAPADPLLATPDERYTHGEVLDAARATVDRFGLDADDSVAVRGPLSEPGVVAAGLVAPILASGTIVVPDSSREAVADVAAVGSGDVAPEARQCCPEDVPLRR